MEKEYILQEIKRTAKENGGVAPGIAKFENETGIKVEDCVGKYWARWSDALVEAGLSPNQMQAAYDESFLFQKYIELARELGKLPVKAEIQLRKNKPGFPSTHAYRRFGSKTGFIRSLKAYCEKNSGFEDIVRMCEQYVPRATEEPQTEKANGSIGFVYLIKSGKAYKLGRSNSAGRREYELSIQLPDKLKTVHVIRTDDPPGIEAYWHNRFAAKRKNGEWFELDSTDVAAFRRRKFM
jgi:hypothetical protein